MPYQRDPVTTPSRIERIMEVLHASSAGATTLASRTRLTGGALTRFQNKRRAASGIRSSSAGTTGVAEQVAGILDQMHPDDLEALIERLEERD